MLTAILDHRPDLRIVGARVYSPDKRVYSPDKNGVDVGTLAGRDPSGVVATTDVDEVLALDADCVLYTPRIARLDEVCALLSGGKRRHDRVSVSPAAACRPPNGTGWGRPARPATLRCTAVGSIPATCQVCFPWPCQE